LEGDKKDRTGRKGNGIERKKNQREMYGEVTGRETLKGENNRRTIEPRQI